MVSIDEVARRAGVSTATVSRALSGRGQVSAASRAKVREAADALGYVVSSQASALASGRTRNVGVIVPHLDRWFFSTVLSGISDALMREGYDVTLYNITADEDVRRDVFSTFVRRRRVDAVIAVAIRLGDLEADRLLDLGIPVIAIGGPNPRLTTLTVDDSAVARLAVRHLLDLGHRDVAHIGARPEFDREFRVPTQRRLGFEGALADAGIAARPDLVEPADFTVEGGYRAAMRLLDRTGPRPTAIFAASDEMAVGAILAARDLGLRVPEDLSMIGVDGHDLGAVLRLTTVDQFPLDQGRRAAAELLRMLSDPDARPAPTALPFELVVRGSTGSPDRG
ncbi:DNA-binding LacI/PurR family transcriptional regulator [Microbacterium resistens]|uniref:DNA-binding LacI/PurR family transcriptional regulator n=1 Tax=Microbacterium resistens TaxID=156977 RepID=A0ABU1SCX2_9MICO|nr:LacI family DNA-binding transcriptional regulator [Microbacterium resistens]MDR6866753.1 DNA-binding LacI/PurR family transcriptional regulator [Microbacterium resistens]